MKGSNALRRRYAPFGHDEWTSTTRDFDTGVGFNNLGLQVRVVGADRAVRMGLVGDGPSDVGGWQGYPGAPTQ